MMCTGAQYAEGNIYKTCAPWVYTARILISKGFEVATAAFMG